MIFNIKPTDLIKSEQFIREPVDEICNEIKENSSKKIILNSGRGTGKTTILANLEDKSLGSKDQFILTRFDSIITLAKNPSDIYNEKIFEHYYELVFSSKLLSFVKNNYRLAYEVFFRGMDKVLSDIIEDTNKYIRNMAYENNNLDTILNKFEVTSEILKVMKSELNIETLNLMIDRFDYTNGSSEYTQNLLKDYFDLFDKVIITTDDMSIDKKSLNDKGYDFIDKNYGKDKNVVRKIMKTKINYFNEFDNKNNIHFDESYITDEMYDNLIEKTNGNISVMIDSVRKVTELFVWYGRNTKKIDEIFNASINENLDSIKELKKININSPKLYL